MLKDLTLILLADDERPIPTDKLSNNLIMELLLSSMIPDKIGDKDIDLAAFDVKGLTGFFKYRSIKKSKI